MTQHATPSNHYALLGIKPTASPQDIRRAYRDLSKLYHPDTTTLAPEVATEKFKVLNEAYATLSNPETRTAYDYSIGISRVAVIQAPSYLNRPASERDRYEKSNAYLDPTDRPLSAGEMFALFILGVTFIGCLILVFTVGWTKGTLVLHDPAAPVLSETGTPSLESSPAPKVDAEPQTSSQSTPLHPAQTRQSPPLPLPPSRFSSKII